MTSWTHKEKQIGRQGRAQTRAQPGRRGWFPGTPIGTGETGSQPSGGVRCVDAGVLRRRRPQNPLDKCPRVPCAQGRDAAHSFCAPAAVPPQTDASAPCGACSTSARTRTTAPSTRPRARSEKTIAVPAGCPHSFLRPPVQKHQRFIKIQRLSRTHNNAWRPRPTTIYDTQPSALGSGGRESKEQEGREGTEGRGTARAREQRSRQRAGQREKK